MVLSGAEKLRQLLIAGAIGFAAVLPACGTSETSSAADFSGEAVSSETTAVAGEAVGWESIPENASAEDGSGDSGRVGSETVEGDSGDGADSADTDEADTGGTDDGPEEGNTETSGDDGADSAAESETAETSTSAVQGIDGTLTGTDEAKALMTDFMTRWNLNSSNYAVAYKNLSTGEVFYYNELKQWDACSTYKFPLNLLYYDMEAAGEITEDTIIPGTDTPLSECHHQSLQFSNNELSEAMVNNLGAYDVMKQNMRKYFTLTDAEIDSSYYHHNYFCARMMMDCSEYLYNHQAEYPDALAYLEAAQPGEYFKTSITDCTIAQKYGLRDGYNHDAGIIFAQTPFVLSVYTYNAGGNELISQTAKLFYDYTEK